MSGELEQANALQDYYKDEMERLYKDYSAEKVGYLAEIGDTRELAVSTATPCLGDFQGRAVITHQLPGIRQQPYTPFRVK